MKMKLITAAALAAASASSYAVGPGALGPIDNTPITVGNSVAGPVLFDVYTFTLVDPGILSGVASSLDFSPFLGLTGFSVALQDSTFTVIGTDSNPADGFSFAGLTSGSYSLTFFGLTTGTSGGSYGGAIFASTTPIPEPETYALMIAGLGVIGLIASRRRVGA